MLTLYNTEARVSEITALHRDQFVFGPCPNTARGCSIASSGDKSRNSPRIAWVWREGSADSLQNKIYSGANHWI